MITRDHFRLRSYQRRVLEARRAGYKRFCQVIHRRAGKDRTWLNLLVLEMLQRVGVYFHVFPSLNQGRRDIWDNIVLEHHDGVERSVKMISAFPPELVKSFNETEMQVELINGSIYQIMGADSQEAIDRLRGPNPIGIVFSEYAFMDPKAWDVLEPVLLENGGFAAFIYTPKDESHGWKLYEYAREHPEEWFTQFLTIEDTRRDGAGESGEPVIRPSDLDALRARGVREEDIQREYYCSFKGFLHGTIYGDLISNARSDKRIARFPYVINAPVGACFDIGVTDATAIWFYQMHSQGIFFIDYIEDTLKTAQTWARVLREKPYLYGKLSFPWDARFSAADYFTTVGFTNVDIAPKLQVQVGIDKVRERFSTFYFDSERCSRGIQCIERYSRSWDDTARVFASKPVHDEFSHGADALRTGAVAGFGLLGFAGSTESVIKIESEFDPRIPLVAPERDVFGRMVA